MAFLLSVFGDVVVIVPMGVSGPAYIRGVCLNSILADVRRPRIVHVNVIDAVERYGPADNHHVTAAAVPVPRERERFLLAVDLILHLAPRQSCIRRVD